MPPFSEYKKFQKYRDKTQKKEKDTPKQMLKNVSFEVDLLTRK